MEITDKNITECIKIMAAAGGISLAELARRTNDSPQGLNQRLKSDKLQNDIEYLSRVARACGFRFRWSFEECEKDHTTGAD